MIQIILNSNTIDINQRSYQKLQSVIANIGGAFNVVMVVSSFISKYITFQFLHVELLNDFLFNDDDESDKKKNDEITKATTNLYKFNNYINKINNNTNGLAINQINQSN